MSIRVLVVDDQALVRAGFVKLLEPEPDLHVVGEAGDGSEAVEAAVRTRPDVILMDIRMPRLDGIEATRRIRAGSRAARVLVLTTYDGDEDIYQSLSAGAKAYLLKDVTLEELVDCIEKVHGGQTCVPPVVAAKLAERTASPELTERELAVLRLIVAGRSNKEIGAVLTIEERTVKAHVAKLMRKVGVQNRIALSVHAITHSLVTSGK